MNDEITKKRNGIYGIEIREIIEGYRFYDKVRIIV